jgi:Fe-S-cluster containining protein
MAGQVEVSLYDRRRLAKRLGLTLSEFDDKHVVRSGRQRCIKLEDVTCQFLGKDKNCTVYDARPTDCRGYVCWDQDDKTVYHFALLTQAAMRTVRRMERRVLEEE